MAVEITGIVYPPGPGGGRAGGEEEWTLHFSLQPWRRPDGGVDERSLFVSQPRLSQARLDELMDSIEPYDILRLRVELTDDPSDPTTLNAHLLEVLGKEPADAELNQRAADLQKAVTVEDPFFGTLELDRSLNWYEKTFEWNSRPVQLCLSRDDSPDEGMLFRHARSLWDQQEQWEQRVRDYAVEELLDLKNDTWLDEDEGEEELTPEQFVERMSLESIVVYPDGAFEFTYDDGGLFWGHVIQVSGTLSEGPTNAGIAG